MHPWAVPREPHFVHLSWAVRRLSSQQAKYIKLFYGDAALKALGGVVEPVKHPSGKSGNSKQ
jgi:hypothetical protein